MILRKYKGKSEYLLLERVIVEQRVMDEHGVLNLKEDDDKS
ncbi:MAG TPA: hypothetical protein PK033_15715 [Acetivibrio sp.]|nr:hypothetical protein [Acetivibrio sp.]